MCFSVSAPELKNLACWLVNWLLVVFCTMLITFLASCCYMGRLGVLQSAMVQVTEAYVLWINCTVKSSSYRMWQSGGLIKITWNWSLSPDLRASLSLVTNLLTLLVVKEKDWFLLRDRSYMALFLVGLDMNWTCVTRRINCCLEYCLFVSPLT